MKYKGFLGCIVTEGIKEIAEQKECWWLVTDIMSSSMALFRNKEDFLVCQFKVHKDGSAVLSIGDGRGNEVYNQRYLHTTLNEDLKIWALFNEAKTYTLMLPEEY